MINKDLENKLLLIKGTVQIRDTFAVDNLIDKIIKTGNINSLSSANRTLLYFFAMQPNREDLLLISEELIKNGININSMDKDGMTALHECVLFNNVEMVKLLLKYEANVDIKDDSGLNVFDYAKNYKKFDIIQLLLDKKAQNNVITEELKLSLLDIIKDHSDVHMAVIFDQILKTKNINFQDKNGNTILHYFLFSYVIFDDLNLVKLLLVNGINPNIKNDEDSSIYDIADFLHRNDIIELLKEKEEENDLIEEFSRVLQM